MHRRFVVSLLCAFGLILALTGCNKSADQQNANGSKSSSAPDSAQMAKQEPPPPAPKPIIVSADTPIAVVLDEAISSKTATPGQTFSATVEEPIEAEGKVAIPKGARATGVVKDAKSAGRFKGGALLDLTLTKVEINGKEYEIKTSAPTLSSKGKGKRSAALIGGGAVAGALIGALAGGGKGAAIGAAVGAGAGTGGAAFTGNRDITLDAETPLTFKLTEPLEIHHHH